MWEPPEYIDKRPLRLLDLFCGAGGAGVGYHRAGFEVTGVDIDPQPRYPFRFIQTDALELSPEHIAKHFDVVHASPPCQRYTKFTNLWGNEGHPDLIEATRELLILTGLPYIIENVQGAPLLNPVRLCGSSFGLDVLRHRLFESNVSLAVPPCAHHHHTPRFAVPDKRTGLQRVVACYGALNYAGERELRQRAIGVDWMTVKELAEAIPPAYTEYLGRQVWLSVRARQGRAA